MDLKEKRVLVFGTGISGIGAAQLLHKVGAVPVLYDGNPKGNREQIRKSIQEETEIILGELPEPEIRKIDFVVLSPGVPTDLPMIQEFQKREIPFFGEVELAYLYGHGDVLAITGTNGKTTTTSLLGDIVKHHVTSSYVVGNIGIPYTGIALDTVESSVVVAEISSFQLETILTFHPKVSAILNITPDHLNRHHTMEEYIRVKERITENQGENDICVLNYEDHILREFAGTLKCKVLFFSSLHTLEKGIYLENDRMIYRDDEKTEVICSTKDLNLLGRHNHENVMAAIGMAISYGIPIEEIKEVVLRFQSVEHRIEFVTEKEGVYYYNDSKGTNPDAAIKGIQAMERPTVLIGGGYDKDSSYDEWIQAFEGKVKWLVLLGETKEKIAAAARKHGFDHILFADTLEEAVQICFDKSERGDAVLLSPACASWDMFPNYEVRGKLFKEYVHSL